MTQETAVKHNSPDPTKYHANISSIPGTMIPRAGKDGLSLAFDPNRPQTVIVDPEERGGGFTLDLAALSSVRSKFNSAATQASAVADVSQFYKSFSEVLKEKPAKPERKTMDNVESGFGPIPPISTPNLEAKVNEALDRERLEAERVLDNIDRHSRSVMHPGYQDLGPTFEVLIRQLNQQGAALNALMTSRTEEKPEEKEEVSTKENTVTVDTQIEFLTPKPQRPQYETYFEMQKMGTMAARYHAVVPGQDCLALIYDTRFEDGFQYLPPNLGQEKITVSVPKLSGTPFNCSSLGLHWSIGCLDVIILIKHGE